MFAYFGKLVEKLRRVKIAFLELDVPPGKYRPLTPQEVEHFQRVLSAKPVATPKPKPAAQPVTPKRKSPIRSKFPKKKKVDGNHS